MITPNDTLLNTNDQKLDITKYPSFDVFKKEDITHHQIKEIRNTKTKASLFCVLCGHEIPITDNMLNKINSIKLSRQSKLQSRHMGRRARHQRAILAGIARANKAGQQLKPSTLQKCTGRRIYKEVASALQIQNPTTT